MVGSSTRDEVAKKSRRKKSSAVRGFDGIGGFLRGFVTTVMRLECDTLDGLPELTTRRRPNHNIILFFYGFDTMLRENEYFILINRGNIRIYTLVLGQKDIKVTV